MADSPLTVAAGAGAPTAAPSTPIAISLPYLQSNMILTNLLGFDNLDDLARLFLPDTSPATTDFNKEILVAYLKSRGYATHLDNVQAWFDAGYTRGWLDKGDTPSLDARTLQSLIELSKIIGNQNTAERTSAFSAFYKKLNNLLKDSEVIDLLGAENCSILLTWLAQPINPDTLPTGPLLAAITKLTEYWQPVASDIAHASPQNKIHKVFHNNPFSSISLNAFDLDNSTDLLNLVAYFQEAQALAMSRELSRVTDPDIGSSLRHSADLEIQEETCLSRKSTNVDRLENDSKRALTCFGVKGAPIRRVNEATFITNYIELILSMLPTYEAEAAEAVTQARAEAKAIWDLLKLNYSQNLQYIQNFIVFDHSQTGFASVIFEFIRLADARVLFNIKFQQPYLVLRQGAPYIDVDIKLPPPTRALALSYELQVSFTQQLIGAEPRLALTEVSSHSTLANQAALTQVLKLGGAADDLFTHYQIQRQFLRAVADRTLLMEKIFQFSFSDQALARLRGESAPAAAGAGASVAAAAEVTPLVDLEFFNRLTNELDLALFLSADFGVARSATDDAAFIESVTAVNPLAGMVLLNFLNGTADLAATLSALDNFAEKFNQAQKLISPSWLNGHPDSETVDTKAFKSFFDTLLLSTANDPKFVTNFVDLCALIKKYFKTPYVLQMHDWLLDAYAEGSLNIFKASLLEKFLSFTSFPPSFQQGLNLLIPTTRSSTTQRRLSTLPEPAAEASVTDEGAQIISLRQHYMGLFTILLEELHERLLPVSFKRKEEVIAIVKSLQLNYKKIKEENLVQLLLLIGHSELKVWFIRCLEQLGLKTYFQLFISKSSAAPRPAGSATPSDLSAEQTALLEEYATIMRGGTAVDDNLTIQFGNIKDEALRTWYIRYLHELGFKFNPQYSVVAERTLSFDQISKARNYLYRQSTKVAKVDRVEAPAEAPSATPFATEGGAGAGAASAEAGAASAAAGAGAGTAL